MDPGMLIALGVIAAVTTVGNWLLPSREKRMRRELEAYPGSLVFEGHGAVRVKGRVRGAGELLQAPLTGRHCVAYELVVVGALATGGGSTPGVRRRLVDERNAGPFFVTDESGTARIDMAGPFRLGLRPGLTGTTGGAYPGRYRDLSELLESRGLLAATWLGRWRQLQFAEAVLREDDVVSVGGPSNEEVDPTGERADPRSPPVRLVLRGTEAHPVLIVAEVDGAVMHKPPDQATRRPLLPTVLPRSSR